MALNVIALGGNAILEKDPTDLGQKETVRVATDSIAEFIKSGEQVVICHGNGPQVGNLLLQQKATDSEKNPAFKLDSDVAMTEGSIGYWIQQSLGNELRDSNISVTSVVSQVEVDINDPSFNNPTKPIGPFYTKEEMSELAAGSSDKYVEDAGRGYRKVVPSPKPVKIVEGEAIKQIIDAGIVPIVAGGGGIPVIKREDDSYEGIEAVIDKDFAAEKVAEEIGAKKLIILTAVDNVFINFGKENQEALSTVTVSELEKYIAEEQFAKGSMLPKVQAAIAFVKGNKEREAIITSINNLSKIAQGFGTKVIDD